MKPVLVWAGAVAGAIWLYRRHGRQPRFIDSRFIDPARFLPYPRHGLDVGAIIARYPYTIDPGR
jgi:hypothetical protein